MGEVIQEILRSNADIRYAALYTNGKLDTATRQGLQAATTGESDKYEELLVNPVLLQLVKQRGDIDCGGAQFMVIRYGYFYQWIRPVIGGHVSVCMEASADPMEAGKKLEVILRSHSLL